MGSLFKLRDYWTAPLREECNHSGAFAVSNIDNALDGKQKIVIGSFQGNLRVILPVGKGNIRTEEILLEKKFNEPILQVLTGNFVSEDQESLALLFPKSVVLATVVHGEAAEDVGDTPWQQEGQDSDGDGDSDNPDQKRRHRHASVRAQAEIILQLRIIKEYRFDHATYNFTRGRFGRSATDIVCVQSLDGQLSFMDAKKMICQRFLPENQFLVPGFLTYCDALDLLVTNNSALELVAYKYSVITSSSEGDLSGPREGHFLGIGEDGKEVKTQPRSTSRITPAWTFNLGEDVTGMCVSGIISRSASEPRDLVVLCEHTLYVLTQEGRLVFNKRLDVASTCLATYPTAPRDSNHRSENILVGTVTGSINVYDEVSLQWSAKRVNGPVMSLEVAKVNGVHGLIVCLGFDGTLSLNYLGTDPASEPVEPCGTEDISYEEAEKEYKHLQHVIKRALASNGSSNSEDQAGGAGTGKKAQKGRSDSNEILELLISHSPTISPESLRPGVRRLATMGVTLRSVGGGSGSGAAATNVSFSVHVKAPLSASPQSVELAQVSSAPSDITVIITAEEPSDFAIPTSLEAQLVVTYTNATTNQMRMIHRTVLLPFLLLATPVPPVPQSDFVLQINANRDAPPSLSTDLFRDLTQAGEIAPNIMSIMYGNETYATVIVSKNAARFRLQASTLEALWLLASELVRRLQAHFTEGNGDGSALSLDVPDDIPVDSYLRVVDTHIQIREELVAAYDALAVAAQTFRTVQKRLLFRLKDINPSPLDNLDFMFEQVYKSLQTQTEAVENSTTRLKQASAMLSCCNSLVALLLDLKCRSTLRNEKDRALLKAVFSPEIPITVDAGWEEFTEATLSQFQHVSMGRQAAGTSAFTASPKTTAAALAKKQDSITSSVEPLAAKQDTSNLKAQLKSFIQRIVNGEAIDV